MNVPWVKIFLWGVGLCAMACAIANIAMHISASCVADECETVFAVRSFLEHGRFLRIYGGEADWIPPLYFTLLAGIGSAIGQELAEFRVVGVILLVVTCMLVHRFAGRLAGAGGSRWAGWMGVVLYLSSPVVVQGSMLAEIDTTLFPFLSLLVCVTTWEECRRVLPRIWPVALVCAVAVAIKPTTTLGFLPIVIAIYLFGSDHRAAGVRRAILFLLTSVFFATIMLATCFWLSGNHLIGVVAHILNRFNFGNGPAFSMTESIRTAGELSLWVSPVWWVLVALLTLLLLRRWRRSGDRESFVRFMLLAYAMMVLGFYLFFGGMCFGFPRYFAPAFPIVAAIAAAECTLEAKAGKRKAWWVTCFVAVAVQWAGLHMVHGDPLYYYYVILRQVVVDTGLVSMQAVSPLILCLFLSMLSGVIWFLGWRSSGLAGRGIYTGLVCAIVVYGLIVQTHQAQASYQTTYNYGSTGTRAMVEFVVRNQAEGACGVLSTIDVVYATGGRGEYIRGEGFWAQPDKVLERLQLEPYDIMVVSERLNTVSTIRRLRADPDLQGYLQRNFVFARIGSHDVWVRK